jgi:acetyl esterase
MPLDPKAKVVIDLFTPAEPVRWAEISAAEYRAQLDMAMAPPPDLGLAEIVDGAVPGAAGAIPIRIYRASLSPSQPCIVYYHGGGFVLGGLDTHDGICRRLCAAVGATVISVDYRLAPEHVFPAAVDDCYDATSHVLENAAAFGVDHARVAVAGDSAGGNLAAVVAILNRDRGGPPIRQQTLIYPVTDMTFQSESYIANAEGYFLTSGMMEWFGRQYTPAGHPPHDPLISPLFTPDLSALPPAVVITAEYDPLRDEGEAYAKRLAESGVPTVLKRYDGMIHGFFTMSGVLDQAEEAIALVAAELKTSFNLP